MYFQKIRHPSNFAFANWYDAPILQCGGDAKSRLITRVRDLGQDVFHVEMANKERWPLDARLVRMQEDAFAGTASSHRMGFSATGRLSLLRGKDEVVLASVPAAGVGVCGSAWLVQWARNDGMRFYGQGEKLTGLEKTGKRTKFWNADVWADHAMPVIEQGAPDPQYAAIPYLLVRTSDAPAARWIGILVDHPGAVFMDTGSNWFFFGHDDQNAPPAFWFGADQGLPAFYVIAGDSPASVTERLQRLVGTTPLPPVWALGHHQSRWGYGGPEELNRLDAAFTEHQIPCDGLWLDIDYMDNYKVFTTDPARFKNLQAELAVVQAHGRRVVPILDPGVKVDASFALAKDGLAADIYCQNPEGQPFVGFVWPGRTWFPDYSLPEGRDWWAKYCKAFMEAGFDGAWIDMNDPSTGAQELDDMRFQKGQWPHWTYHNQYATGMAEATRAGFLTARPNERPFVLSRSASAGSSRTTALWTGDNFSNWHHLRLSIHTSINLALSGIPFNGPDVPGFGGNADAELAVAWYKAGCLFPFFRNHSSAGTAEQEPWAFGPEALDIIRQHIRLRYKLLPYTYQLWLAQAEHGTAVMRPLFYDFVGTPTHPLDTVDDQFLIGPALMQAPLLHQGQQTRAVLLPGTGTGGDQGRWLDMHTGKFLSAGQSITVTSSLETTPIYLREGHLIPMQVGQPTQAGCDLADMELHVILGRGCTQEATLDYVADDGLSYDYTRGERGRYRFTARREGDVLKVAVEVLQAGYTPLRVRVVGYGSATCAEIARSSGSQTLSLQPHVWRMTGVDVHCAMACEVVIQ